MHYLTTKRRRTRMTKIKNDHRFVIVVDDEHGSAPLFQKASHEVTYLLTWSSEREALRFLASHPDIPQQKCRIIDEDDELVKKIVSAHEKLMKVEKFLVS